MPGAGIVAATRFEEQQPTWIVSGTDAAGLDRAVELLDRGALRDRFAVATDAPPVPLPLPAPRRGRDEPIVPAYRPTGLAAARGARPAVAAAFALAPCVAALVVRPLR